MGRLSRSVPPTLAPLRQSAGARPPAARRRHRSGGPGRRAACARPTAPWQCRCFPQRAHNRPRPAPNSPPRAALVGPGVPCRQKGPPPLPKAPPQAALRGARCRRCRRRRRRCCLRPRVSLAWGNIRTVRLAPVGPVGL